MNERLKDLLERKPKLTTEEVMKGIKIAPGFWEELMKEQIELSKKQKEEWDKLKPTNETLTMRFDI